MRSLVHSWRWQQWQHHSCLLAVQLPPLQWLPCLPLPLLALRQALLLALVQQQRQAQRQAQWQRQRQ